MQDVYYRIAKGKGYRARSAFKLVHIDEDFGILKDARRVVDLCSCPGGWSQVLAERMFPNDDDESSKRKEEEFEKKEEDRTIVAVDLFEMSPIPNVHFIKGDITHVATAEKIIERFQGQRADLVVSDGAPDVLGVHDFDEYVQHQLVLAALNISTHVLAEGGSFVAKIFRGRGVDRMYAFFRRFFEHVTISKPRACRNSSIEGFVVCQNYRCPKGYVPDMTRPLLLTEEYGVADPLPDASSSGTAFKACGSSPWDADMSYPVSAFADAFVHPHSNQNGGDVSSSSQQPPGALAPSAPPINPPYKQALSLKRQKQTPEL